ncbi:hypothetical protein RB608_18175 [Nocardioides sp. LHD-245]|nr:hypothetical protein [Nocardioides sp. LHD-245]
MARVRDLRKKKQPFCPVCFRYMTRAQARAHSQHARLIRWPKK